MKASGTYRWSSGKNKWDPVDLKQHGKKILIGIVALIVLIGALTCFYTVDDKQQAPSEKVAPWVR